ncbi:MAG: amino acid adenylation domain-containing protein [Nitrospira sp.]|nr:amino acid adenylation domain-containing protein [Nitrospira sp.]
MRDKSQIEAMYYLSPLQEGLLFHRVAEGEADPYWYQYGYRLQGDLQEDLFVQAWQEAVRRHAILRTAFIWEGVERPLQVVRRDVDMPIHRHDFRGLSVSDREKAVEALLMKDRQDGMDFLVPPLMRLHLVATSQGEWYLFNSHHHILLDGWSMSLLLQDVLSIYGLLRKGGTPRRCESRPYREYIAWRNRQDERAAEVFWRTHLAGFRTPTTLALPGSDELETDERLLYAEQETRIDPSRWKMMQAFAQKQRVTINTLIQGACAVLLNRYSGERDVLFGATVSGRPVELAGSDNMVGLFINTIPVRVAVAGDQTIAEWLSALQVHNSTIRQYEWTPLTKVQRWSEIAAGRPLFDTLVVFESYPEQGGEGPATGLTISSLKTGRHDGTEQGPMLTTGRNNYPLSLMVEPGEELRLIVSYARRRFTHASVRRLLNDVTTLIDCMMASPTGRLFELSLAKHAERRLSPQSSVSTLPAPAACIHDVFADYAHKDPDRIAVAYEGDSLTYRELNTRADSLASILRTMGVGPEALIGICMDRSLDMIIGLFAILKAGAGFVPIDPKLPQARVAFMVRDSGANIVLTHSAGAESLQGIDTTCIHVDREWPVAQAGTIATHPAPVRPYHLAYVIYTSGSTGEPKGVSVEHRQLVAYVRAVLERLALPSDASLATVSTVGADLGHTSIFGALCSGRTLHVLSTDWGFDPDAMASYMHGHRIGVLKIAPSHLGGLLEAAEPAHVLPQHCLILGGERVRPELVNKVKALAPTCTIVNHYGPTETTVGVIANRLDDWSGDESVVPIGWPLEGAHAYILDHDMNVVPLGVPGELYIGGAGLARGYLRRPALTADRFIPNLFGGQPGERLYRTGDRVREREDGAIEYIGRMDHQVKLRGFRIELGEIENRLRSESDIGDAVALVRDVEGGSQQLVAYITAPAPVDIGDLRNRLSRALPEYMVPASIVVMESWPLTPNGKVDRAALPDPQNARTGSAGYVAPRNEVEATLAAIWADVLRIERIGIHDNFFSLGGDSIRSLQVIARANQKGVKLTPKQLFECQTVAEAAAVAIGPATAQTPMDGSAAFADLPAPADTTPVKSMNSEGPGVFPLVAMPHDELALLREDWGQIEDLYPLSPMQEGMLFHTLLNPGSGIYLMQQRYMWRGPLDRDQFVAAWHRVIQRYQILRTSFMWKDLPKPLQAVHTTVDLSSVIEELDWRECPESEHDERLQELLQAELTKGLELARPPLMRIHLIRLEDESYAIVRSFHHILTDDWCFSLLMMDFRAYYQASLQGRDLELPPVKPYRDYIAWLKKQDLAAAETFWRKELKDCSGPTALGIEQATVSGEGDDTAVDDVYMELSAQATEQLQTMASRHHLTPNTILQGAWALLLAHYNGQHDVVFGVTVAGRPTDLEGVESIVGLFINSLPLKVRIQSEMSVAEWLKELLAQNYRIRQFEYAPLIDIQRWGGMAAGQSLFHSLLVFENAPKDPRLGEQWGTIDIAYDHDRVHTNYPMTVVGYPGRELGVRLSFQTRCFDRESVQRMLEHLKHLLECMVANPETRLGDLSLITDEERRQLIENWSMTNESPLPDYRFNRLFEAQVVRTPDAVAAACQGRSLTYAELNRRANVIAHALRTRGAGPDCLVAILNERGLDLLLMIVGIFKAGAAYLPLDPGHPERRLAQVLEDSRAAMILTTKGYLDRIEKAMALGAGSAPVYALERLLTEEVDDSHPAVDVSPANLAYVMYTSGSTGVPKGAMVEHQAMVNHLLSKIPALQLTGCDIVAQTASQCFDISVWQFLTALLCGGRVEIIPSSVVQDPRELLHEIRARNITVLEIVPSLMNGLLEEEPLALPLRWMLPTGEALSPELCRKWFACYPAVPLVNAYGPAECADDCALHTMIAPDRSESGYVPIGRPIPNLRLYLSGPDLELTPVGVAGELCIGGVGVGRGYRNDPARTAASFVPDPFATKPGLRLYRSGDLVRFRSDGILEFLGRRDHQVKIRGYRIELGEIEARILHHPAVREAVVVAREDRPGDKRLVAYIVSERTMRDAASLRAFVAETLPDYMVPTVVMFLDVLPLTPNGKIDRKALPIPEEGDLSPRGGGPRTAVQEILAGIWGEILGTKHVGIHDNFFELGGHSLLATQVVSRIRSSFQVELPLRSLFEAPTVEAFSAVIEQACSSREGTSLVPLTPVERHEPLALSFAQQRLWFLSQMEPEGWSYNLPFALRLSGTLDVDALSRSFEQVIARHETLRTTFHESDGEPVQVIGSGEVFALQIDDLSGVPEERRNETVRRAASVEVRRPFRLDEDQPIRARVLRLTEQEHVLLVTLHHIAADAWSMTLLASEIAVFYQARVGQSANTADGLPPLPVQYADFAHWQRQWLRGPVLEAHLAYWKQRLGVNPPVLKLPTGRPRPAVQSFRGARHPFIVPMEQAERLRMLSRKQGVTLFMTLLAAFNTLLFRTTGQEDILLGTDVANRNREETEGLVGFFVNLLPLRSDLSGNPTFLELLAQVRRTALEAYAHQDLPFEKIVETLKLKRDLGGNPLVQALLVLQNVPPPSMQLPGLEVGALEFESEVARFDLGLFMEDSDEGMTGLWKYSTDLFDADTIAALSERFVTLLGSVVAHPEATLSTLEILSHTEKESAMIESKQRAENKFKRFKTIQPKAVNVAQRTLVERRYLESDQLLPLVLQPAVDDVDLAAWAQDHRTKVEQDLLAHGAILFRGFALTSPEDFEQVAQALCPTLFGEYGDLPREKAGRHLYGSTPYPADKTILFHNESSHLHRWPLKQSFFCVQASQEGGETPIVDCRKMYEGLRPELREKFTKRALMYVRNFTPGFDVSWQEFFHTEDKSVVEETCRQHGVEWDWTSDGGLRTRQICPAIVKHPRTGDVVFFNQIQLHHISYLEPAVRNSLVEVLGIDRVPRNVYFGDGSPIDDETAAEIGELYERTSVRFPWRNGDLLMLDNMLVAHARSPFTGPRKIVVAMGEMINQRDVQTVNA